MFTAEFTGVNDFLVKSSRLLLENGVVRETRGQICYELPEPFMFKIAEPTARLVTISERKWNFSLPYAESLWLASGRNNMDFITHYLGRMNEFSDDGKFMRAGYGSRLRSYNGDVQDYQVSEVLSHETHSVDQFKYVVNCFGKDLNTRRAVINIDDTMKDEFGDDGEIKITKDIPCTRLLHFLKNGQTGKLDLTVYMRSNDILWGASAVNIFNFTFMQEYFAAMLGLEVGSYYHIANNFHYYEDKRDMLKSLATVQDYVDVPYLYDKEFSSLEEFDEQIKILSEEETKMRTESIQYNPEKFRDTFFKDWYSVLFHKNHKEVSVVIENPTLRKLLSYDYARN